MLISLLLAKTAVLTLTCSVSHQERAYISEYNLNSHTLFSDVATYKKIKKSPLKDLQDKVYKLLKRWNVNKYLNRRYEDHELTQTDTSLPRSYGLAKIH